MIIAHVTFINQSDVVSYLFNSSLFLLYNPNFTVTAGSCLSWYHSFTSEFDNPVAQDGQYRCILNHLYTRFLEYKLSNTLITDSIKSRFIVMYACSISARLPI